MTKQTVVIEKNTYVDGILVDKDIRVVEPGPDWIKRIVLTVAIPCGFWFMAMGGMFG